MGLEQLNFAGFNKVEVAIMRLKEFESPEGYYFADSYGKDSCVVRRLLYMANSKHIAYYNQTGLDAPELVLFGRKYHPETLINKPIESFWRMFPKNGFPTRKIRWCCKLLKETGGRGNFIVQGIRWQESSQRKSRKMVEVCNKDSVTKFLNPIIDWTSKEVWEFIKAENIPYCSLYDERYAAGNLLFKRLGCVLCPMGTAKQAKIQIERFPKQALAWQKAFQRFYDLGWDSVISRWADWHEMWVYWLTRKGEPKVNDAQCIMFDN